MIKAITLCLVIVGGRKQGDQSHCKGYKRDTLYALHVSNVKNHVVAITKVSKVSLCT